MWALACCARNAALAAAACCTCVHTRAITQPTNKYFIQLLNEEWSVVVNEATGKPQVRGQLAADELMTPATMLRR